MSLKDRLKDKVEVESDKPLNKAAKSKVDPNDALKIKIQNTVIDSLNIDFSDENSSLSNYKDEVRSLIESEVRKASADLSMREQSKITNDLIDEILGFGPITSLLNDPDVSEVMVNGPRQVYAEKGGKLVLTNAHFKDNHHVLHVIKKIVAPIGRRIDESSPMVDARLPDGSRVNAIIPPLALGGPTIRLESFQRIRFKFLTWLVLEP